MKKILIFKTDRIGDLVNISPVLNNLKKNFPDSEIFLVCSKYNSSLAKYYDFLSKVFIIEKPFILFLFKNYKFFFLKKYDLILQLDGKNHSYLLSSFIRSKKKAAIKFIQIFLFLFFLIFFKTVLKIIMLKKINLIIIYHFILKYLKI